LTHGAGRELGHGGHFLVPFVGLVDKAFALSAPFRRVCLGRIELSHRRPFKREPIGVVDDAIEDGVGEGGLTNHLMPRLHGELASDQRRVSAIAVMRCSSILPTYYNLPTAVSGETRSLRTGATL
jgi:hypothetical protein